MNMRPTMPSACRLSAAGPAPALQSAVQKSRRQRAAPAAPPLPLGQRCALRARLAVGRSRERMREAQTEGKIKGPARAGPLSQSARGLGTARRLADCVPPQNANPLGTELGRVPFPMRYATLRWSVRHGLA